MPQLNKTNDFIKGEKRKTIRPVVKYALKAPLEIKWPKIDADTNQSILNTVLSDFKVYLPIKKSGNRTTSLLNIKLSQHCIVGVNAVTRALERHSLGTVVVCASASNAGLTTHLIPLCIKQKTPACCVKGLSSTVSPLFKMRSVVAIGFKTNKDNIFNDLIDFIVDKAIDLRLPWGQVKTSKQKCNEAVSCETERLENHPNEMQSNCPSASTIGTPKAIDNSNQFSNKRLVELNVQRKVFIPKSKKHKTSN